METNTMTHTESGRVTAAIKDAIAEWPEQRIREYIESHKDADRKDADDLLAIFRAIYHRDPDDEDEWMCIWSHICAGVSHR